ncbi:DUF4062 domain-containing protein [Fusibacter bizertensis]
MKRKLQVFISSTYEDLIEERQAAVQAVLSTGNIPAGMELFSAGDESQLSLIRKWIDESDIYILILGGRYGSIEPTTEKSYIQLEYEYAKSINKPYFTIIINDKALDEKVKLQSKKVLELNEPQKLREFKKMVMSKMCSFYNDTKDIELAIFKKMSEYNDRSDLDGWISGKDLKSIDYYTDEIIRMSNENRTLKTKNEELEKRIIEIMSQHKSSLERTSNKGKSLKDDDFERRVIRVLKLMNAERQDADIDGNVSWIEGDEEKDYNLNVDDFDFDFYYTYTSNNSKSKVDEAASKNIKELIIISIDKTSRKNIEGVLADIRLLIEEQKNAGGTMQYRYIIASRQIQGEDIEKTNNFFIQSLKKAKIKKTSYYQLEIWNEENLSIIETDYGLR